MASLAAMLKDSGYEVSGSDESVYPPMSDFLARKEIRVIEGYNLRNLNPEPDLAVVGNALSRGNPEIEYLLNFRIPYTSLPEAVKTFFLRDRIPVVVTGTHGKSTTTAMIAWGLHSAGLRPDFLVGGLAENFDSSYGLGGGRHFVIEGDEYDSAFFDKGPKFMHYLPQRGRARQRGIRPCGHLSNLGFAAASVLQVREPDTGTGFPCSRQRQPGRGRVDPQSVLPEGNLRVAPG